MQPRLIPIPVTNIPVPMPETRDEHRQHLRTLRKQLSQETQQAAAQAVLTRLTQWPPFNQAKHIACYWACQGELPTHPICQHLWTHQQQVYLPCLPANDKAGLNFVRYERASLIQPNRFGIPEPCATETRSAETLDLILLPVVGFDETGYRLGMGKGYYDRTLAFMQTAAPKTQPTLCGLAYAFQAIDPIPSKPWDIPLHAVVTEQHTHLFHSHQDNTN